MYQPKVKASSPLKRLPVPLKRVIGKLYWLAHDATDYFAESVGHVPSHALRLWVYRALLRVSIGPRTSIHRGFRMYHPARLRIGHHSVINRDVLLDARLGITIGNNVSISEGTFLLTLQHDLQDPAFENQGAPIVIDDYAFVGARAIILPGVTIGRGAGVGAGSIVTHSVEPYTIVAGVPAKPIGRRRQDLDYQLDYRKFLG